MLDPQDVWTPQYPPDVDGDCSPTDRQATASRLSPQVDELLYGGMGGGGKTDLLLYEAMTAAVVHAVPVLLLRRTFPQLRQRRGIIERLRERIPDEVGTYHVTEHVWRFASGGALQLGYLASDGDVEGYVGGEYGLICWDQLEQFSEWQYRRMFHPLRLPDRHPAMRAGWRPRMLATANPGGVGHHWVKSRFVDPAPAETPFDSQADDDEPESRRRVFVPAGPGDNPHLSDTYWRNLRSLPADMQKALIEGDWDVFAGTRFGEQWDRAVHVVTPEQVPLDDNWPRVRGADYGMTNPWGCLWGAKGPDGIVVVYREAYKSGLTPTQQAERIVGVESDAERDMRTATFLDPSCWARSKDQPTAKQSFGVPPEGSIARDYYDAGVRPLSRANNDRLTGAKAVAQALTVREDGRPRLVIYDTCRHLIRTLPSLPRSKTNPEDVDTNAEDHLYDCLRYLLLGASGATRGKVSGASPAGMRVGGVRPRGPLRRTP